MSSPRYLRVKIIPKSARNEIVETMADESLKIRIAAPAEKGKANKELIKFLADVWKIPKANIAIISGHTSRIKLLRITPIIEKQYLPTAFTANTCHCEEVARRPTKQSRKNGNESYVPTRLLRPFRPRNDKPVGRYEKQS